MSPKTPAANTMKATERIQMPGGPGRGMGNATIAQKPISFVASGRRVLALLRPLRFALADFQIFLVRAEGRVELLLEELLQLGIGVRLRDDFAALVHQLHLRTHALGLR